MKNENLEKIDKLNVSKEAKKVLVRINKVSGSENVAMKKSIKNLFITCPHGAGLSEYARVYEAIIISNGVYPVRGKGSYLELAFPYMGSKMDYSAFYNSPRLVAATQNNYTGVFLISFEQWHNFSELNRDAVFEELLNYIDKNKSNISFVFHVLPEFGEADKLARALNGHANIEQLQLSKPRLKEAKEYVTNEMEKTKIYFTDGAKEQLEFLIETKVNTESQAYLGYETLKGFTENLVYEVACICEADSAGIRKIDSKTMIDLSGTIGFSLDEREEKSKLGFMA